MKKSLSLFFTVVVLLLMTACSGGGDIKLTDTQENACEEVNSYFVETAKLLNSEYTKVITKIDNQLVYIAEFKCINNDASSSIANTLSEVTWPRMEEVLEKEDITLVIYYGNVNEPKMYRMYDTYKLDDTKLN